VNVTRNCLELLILHSAVATLRHLVAVSTHRADHHDIILDIFVSGLEHWMSGTCLATDDYPLVYHDLIQSQAAIGCNQLLCGRVSVLWAKHIDEFLSSQPKTHPSSSGHLWVKNMIIHLWDQFSSSGKRATRWYMVPTHPNKRNAGKLDSFESFINSTSYVQTFYQVI
jgi:hypothetical protein